MKPNYLTDCSNVVCSKAYTVINVNVYELSGRTQLIIQGELQYLAISALLMELTDIKVAGGVIFIL